jgi:potassium efflux system protein
VQSVVTDYTPQDTPYRLRCTVGVVHASDMGRVRLTLEEVARRLPDRRRDKDPVVLMTDFADSSVVWEVSVWIDDPWVMRGVRSQLNEAIWQALKAQGIVIAFPQLDVHLDPEVVRALAGRGGSGHHPT